MFCPIVPPGLSNCAPCMGHNGTIFSIFIFCNKNLIIKYSFVIMIDNVKVEGVVPAHKI